jgi:uncharacterized membrane protein
LLIWLVVGFVLLYVPTDFQVKMLAGWQVPVGIYATRFLFRYVAPALAPFSPIRPQVLVAALFIASVIPANLYHFSWRFVDLGRHDYPYYLDLDEVAALQWLEANSWPSDVVLSSLTIGQYIPSVSGNRAFLGHWASTLDFFDKRQMVARFFDSRVSDQERQDILDRFHVAYVFYAGPEQALGDFRPDQSLYFNRVFSSERAAVYRVRDTQQTASMSP